MENWVGKRHGVKLHAAICFFWVEIVSERASQSSNILLRRMKQDHRPAWNGCRKAGTKKVVVTNGLKSHARTIALLGCTMGDGLPTVSKGFGSVLFGETVVLRCCILGQG